jgi:radical SAM superfamily enzyme YgiQ (UPF0313 family)
MKEMKIILIVTPMMDFNHDGQPIPIEMDALRANPNYGAYLLAAVLQSKGYHVVLIDLVAQGSLDITPYIADIEDCSLVGIGATSFSWPSALDVIKRIRQISKDVPIVLGGIHPTIFDRYLLKKFPIQYIIRGEGELALPSLCSDLKNKRELTHVSNLSWINNDGEIIRNAIAPGIPGDDLGSLPLPDYDKLPFNAYHYLPIESSRGCLHDCSFCSTPYRRSWRFIPAENFVHRLRESMKYLQRTISKQIQIVDDEFSINPKRAMEIARIIKERGLKPRMRYCSRVKDVLVDGFVQDLADITADIFLGAECGYDEGLKHTRKGITCQLIESAARKLEEHGTNENATFSFIIGLPWETKSEVEKTIHFAFHLINSFGITAVIHWYIRMPGSQLWHKARNDQLFNESMYDSYNLSHNAYLFRGELKLKPKEIWEIDDMIQRFKITTRKRYPNRETIIYTTPEALIRHFPKELLYEKGHELANLQELSLSVLKTN